MTPLYKLWAAMKNAQLITRFWATASLRNGIQMGRWGSVTLKFPIANTLVSEEAFFFFVSLKSNIGASDHQHHLLNDNSTGS